MISATDLQQAAALILIEPFVIMAGICVGCIAFIAVAAGIFNAVNGGD